MRTDSIQDGRSEEQKAEAWALKESPAAGEERMLKWFAWTHLPENLQVASKPFAELAISIAGKVPRGPERTVALRKLLESKDAAVRAVVNPGG